MTSATVLAAAAAQELNEDTVSPGLLGFGVFVAMAVATWLLIRSMNRHLRKINFDDGSEPGKAGKAGEVNKAAKAADVGGGGDGARPAGNAKTHPPSSRAD
jgi:DNA gyrase/topoisomerase IV subunit B